jgi:hypothetical protein
MGRLDDATGRNGAMVERIRAAPVRYPLRFVVAGDSGRASDFLCKRCG